MAITIVMSDFYIGFYFPARRLDIVGFTLIFICDRMNINGHTKTLETFGFGDSLNNLSVYIVLYSVFIKKKFYYFNHIHKMHCKVVSFKKGTMIFTHFP